MPNQTTKLNVRPPDGARVSVKEVGAGSFTDVGALTGSIGLVLNYDESQVITTAGKTPKRISNMTVAGTINLVNLEYDIIAKLGAGMLTHSTIAASPVSDIADQTVAAGWSDTTLYNMSMVSTANGAVKTSAQPTLTSVTLDPSGTPEVLVEDTEYVVVQDSNSPSGWSIKFLSANMATGSPTTFDIEIVYGTNTPIASEVVTAGSSTVTLDAYEILVQHFNSAGAVDYSFQLYAAEPTSGGFNFGLKGPDEDGIDEMAITFEGKIDTDQADGAQLFRLVQAA